MRRRLLTWIGATDLRAAAGDLAGLPGPIASALKAREFDSVDLICDYPRARSAQFVEWLRISGAPPINLHQVELSSPMAFGEVYTAASRVAASVLSDCTGADASFLISSGTSAMAAVWILLAKGPFYPAELLQASREMGVEIADVPFDIYTEVLPVALVQHDRRIEAGSTGASVEASSFEDLIYASPAMVGLVERAGRVAPRHVTVLIQGETGTGKEVLARTIHTASPRTGALVTVKLCRPLASVG